MQHLILLYAVAYHRFLSCKLTVCALECVCVWGGKGLVAKNNQFCEQTRNKLTLFGLEMKYATYNLLHRVRYHLVISTSVTSKVASLGLPWYGRLNLQTAGLVVAVPT
jgi:hypothetical protein